MQAEHTNAIIGGHELSVPAHLMPAEPVKTAHTPGPWAVIREDDHDGPSKTTFVEQIGPFHIEWHDDLNKGNHVRIEADIALVSAAPDLVNALKEIEPFLEALENDAREDGNEVETKSWSHLHYIALSALMKVGAA
jgi:hypothetical protein